MSKREEQARLNKIIDHAVEEFLLVSDSKVVGRVKELTGKEESLARDFDRLMGPILSQYEVGANRDSRIESAAVPKLKWWRSMIWVSADNLTHPVFSRPLRSAFAALVLFAAGAGLSFPLWRVALGPDTSRIDIDQDHIPRSVPKELPGQRPIHPSTAVGTFYMAQLTKSYSFSKAAEALNRLKEKYPSVLRDQSLVVRRANSGEDPGAYIGGIGGLTSARDAEQICSVVRTGGDLCDVLNVGNE